MEHAKKLKITRPTKSCLEVRLSSSSTLSLYPATITPNIGLMTTTKGGILPLIWQMVGRQNGGHIGSFLFFGSGRGQHIQHPGQSMLGFQKAMAIQMMENKLDENERTIAEFEHSRTHAISTMKGHILETRPNFMTQIQPNQKHLYPAQLSSNL